MSTATDSTMLENARAFFDACETGKGWEVCRQWCHPEATFSCQAEALAEIETLAAYTDWMTGLLSIAPDGHYELRSFAADPERGNVSAYAIFHGTHTEEGGPVPPTGKSVAGDYVYVMEFEDDKIRHMTKIWNAPHSMKQLGWA